VLGIKGYKLSDNNNIDNILSVPGSPDVSAAAVVATKVPDPIPAAPENPEKKRAFISSGEKIHHWGTYLGIDWIFNATAGVLFAYWGKYTDLGKKIWSGPLKAMFTAGLKPFFKNEAYLAESVSWGTTFMSIIAGGMFTIPPLMALENNKVKKSIVEFFDKHIYGKEACENDEKLKKAHEEIDNAPKKDFWRGNSSRFAALTPLLLLVIIKPSANFLQEKYFDKIAIGTKAVFNKIGLTQERLFSKFSPEEAEKRWKTIHNDALGMDLGFGLPYAGLHAFFYNMFAANKAKKDATKETRENAVAPTITEQQIQPELLGPPEVITKQFSEAPTLFSQKLTAQPTNFVEKIQQPADMSAALPTMH